MLFPDETTIEIEDSSIFEYSDLTLIKRYLYDKTETAINYYDMLCAINESTSKPAKTISKFVYDKHGIKLDSETKTHIGNLLSHRSKKKFLFRFTFGCMGEAHEYYNEGSCYWGGYAHSRDYIEHNNGGAIRVYDPDDTHFRRVIGRVWFLPYENEQASLKGIVLFNAYGDGILDHTRQFARLVAKALKTDSSDAHISGICNSEIYINSRNGAFVGKRLPDMPDEYYFTLESPSEYYYEENTVRCDICGEYVNPDDTMYSEYSDVTMCEGCAENYVWIDDDLIPEDETCYINGRYYRTDDPDVIELDYEPYGYALKTEVIEDTYGNNHLMDSGTYGLCEETEEYYPYEELTETINGMVATDVCEDWPICLVCSLPCKPDESTTTQCGNTYCENCDYAIAEEQLPLFPVSVSYAIRFATAIQ